MTITLMVWQTRSAGRPDLAAQETLEDPAEASFGSVVSALLARVAPPAKPFQIVVQAGDSSRGFQLGQGWSDARVVAELWKGYQSLVGVVG